LERRTLPTVTNGVAGTTTSETQIWCTEELGAVLLRVMGSAEKKRTMQIAMTNIQRVGPDPALFTIPPDYKVIERVMPVNPRQILAPAGGASISRPGNQSSGSERQE
jgi:hypothetical protein